MHETGAAHRVAFFRRGAPTTRRWPRRSDASTSRSARRQVYAVCASLTARRSPESRDLGEAGALDQIPAHLAKLPLAKDVDDFAFKNTPINEALVRDLAGGGSLSSAISSCSGEPSLSHNAHLTMSLKVQEQRRLIARRRTFWRPLSSSHGSRDDLGELDVGDADDPRRAFADLACGENAFDNQATHGRRTDREPLRRLVKRRLASPRSARSPSR
jgi:hypothetical protein